MNNIQDYIYEENGEKFCYIRSDHYSNILYCKKKFVRETKTQIILEGDIKFSKEKITQICGSNWRWARLLTKTEYIEGRNNKIDVEINKLNNKIKDMQQDIEDMTDKVKKLEDSKIIDTEA